MRKCFGILFFSFLLFSAATAPCQNESPGDAITGEEYGIYRQAIAKQAGRWAVDSETLAGVRIDPRESSARGIPADPDIIADFNAKNVKPYKLVEAFDHPPAPDLGQDVRKLATFSRIGFDRGRRCALLIMGLTYYYAEDIMNEGIYVFLEKKNGKWTIAKTASAWNMQLGLIR